MKFRLHDYVRVKPGVLLEETGEPIPGWVGRVDEVNDDGMLCIELDAFSLQNLPPRYLQECIEEAEPPTAYYLHEDDLEPAQRRDTQQELAAAQAWIGDLIFGPDEDSELDSDTLQHWTAAFLASPAYAALPEDAQTDAENIISSFGELGFNYGYVQPPGWTAETVREVLVEIIPRKVSADSAYFQNIAPVLEQFFGFLHEQQLHPVAAALQKATRQHGPAMLQNAANPASWGMAKGILMQALEEGLNPEEPGAMERFIAKYNASLGQNPPGKPNAAQPARENPYKHLGRNQPIRVRYADGSIKEGKFKRLEADLLAGKCTLVQEPPFA